MKITLFFVTILGLLPSMVISQKFTALGSFDGSFSGGQHMYYCSPNKCEIENAAFINSSGPQVCAIVGRHSFNGGLAYAYNDSCYSMINFSIEQGSFRYLNDYSGCRFGSVPFVLPLKYRGWGVIKEKWTSLTTDDCGTTLYLTSPFHLGRINIPSGAGTITIVDTTGRFRFINTTWRDGHLYGMHENDMYEINLTDPKNSRFVFNFGGRAPFVNHDSLAISSVEISCGVWETYLFCGQKGHHRVFQGFSKLDFSNGRVDHICFHDSAYFYAIAAQPMELNCPFELDLDADNSSGALENNFMAFGCPEGMTIVDTDVFFDGSKEVLDSIHISFIGSFDSQDSLNFESCLGAEFIRKGAHEVTIYNKGLSNMAFSQCLLSLLYINIEDCPTPGIRQVQFLAYACSDLIDTAVAFVHVPDLACAGMDSSVVICSSDSAFSLFDLLGSTADLGGYWSPSISSVFNPSTDTSGIYTYIVDRDSCDMHQASVQVEIKIALPIDLGNDTVICGQREYLLETKVQGSHIWQDGSTNNTFLAKQTGWYTVSILNTNSCPSLDSIHLTFDVNTFLSLGDVSICSGDTFSFSNLTFMDEGEYSDTLQGVFACDTVYYFRLSFFDAIPTIENPDSIYTLCNSDTIQLTALNHKSYQWSGGQKTQSINVFKPGTYHIEIIDTNGCSRIDSIQVVQGETPKVDFITQAIPCDTFNRVKFDINPLNLMANDQLRIDCLWLNGPNEIGYLFAGKHHLSNKRLGGCYWDTTFFVDDQVVIDLELGDDIYIHQVDSSFSLEPIVVLGHNLMYSWTWNGVAYSQDSIVHFIDLSEDGQLILTIKDESGCQISDTINIHHHLQNDFFVPNIFSPNGDNINDIFEIHLSKGVQVIVLDIYDRWGELIHRGMGENHGWDGRFFGKDVNNGVYIYNVELETREGKLTQSGSITIVR